MSPLNLSPLDAELDEALQPPHPQPGGDATDVTPDDLLDDSGFEQDETPAADAPQASAQPNAFEVNARGGLNIRSGPGTEFKVIGSLPYGTRVVVKAREGAWALIDQVGDGAADGHVLAAYLQEISQTTDAPLTPVAPPASDGLSLYRSLDVSTLQNIMNRCAGLRIVSKLDLKLVVYALNKAMSLASATTRLREIAFLSQAVIETDYFRTFAEYGKGKGKQYSPFYGRGIHQLTWRGTYAACSNAVFHDDRLVQDPDLILTDIETNIKATAWYWRDYKPFNKLADAGDIDSVIHLLYGGTINSPYPAVRHSVQLRRGYYTTIGKIIV